MGLFQSIGKAFSWLTKVFVSHAVSAAPVAVTITEFVKTFLANPAVGFLENLADTITGTNLPTAVAADVNAIIPKILAVELGIEGLPANPTPDQILTFENAVLSAFNVKSNNSKLYTELGAQTYGIIQASVNVGNGTVNFATLVTDIEAAYTDYQKDLAANGITAIPLSQAQGGILDASKVLQSVQNAAAQVDQSQPNTSGQTEQSTVLDNQANVPLSGGIAKQPADMPASQQAG